MPGMMDTILNLGLNDTVVEGLAKLTDNPRFLMTVIEGLSRCLVMIMEIEKII